MAFTSRCIIGGGCSTSFALARKACPLSKSRCHLAATVPNCAQQTPVPLALASGISGHHFTCRKSQLRKGRAMSSGVHTQATGAARALVSVSDKAELTSLAQGLANLGYEIVSTGGSAKAIEQAGVAVRKVEDLTGFPEMLDGA